MSELDQWSEFMDIAKIQADLWRQGWRWQEQMFNDGNPNDCLVAFTKSKDNQYWIGYNYLESHAWGRYPRLDAWKRAHEFLLNHPEAE